MSGWNGAVDSPDDGASRRTILAAAAIAPLIAFAGGAEAKPSVESRSGMKNTEQKKKVVRDLIEVVWRQGRLDELPRFWTTDCVNHADAAPDKGGLAALRQYHAGFAQFFASFSNVQIEVLQQVGEADRVVTQMAARMKHTGAFNGIAPTGKLVTLATIRIDRFVGGKIAEHWSVADIAGFMQQLQA